MKRYIFIILFLSALVSNVRSQVLPGTLDVTGASSITQTIDDLVKEAGIDDNVVSFESEIDANIVSFVLDPLLDPLTLGLIDSEETCRANIFRFSVYMHTNNAPQNVVIEAKTFFNAGDRFPGLIAYDFLLSPLLGPRNLYPWRGGGYIELPNSGRRAVKVFEFIGCRTNIPVQFRVKASSLAVSGTENFEIVYTVLGSVL